MTQDVSQHEEWRPISGYEGRYEISDLGRVRSLVLRAPRLLVPNSGGRKGYWTVRLRAPGIKPKVRRVHQMVLEAFVGPRPSGTGGAHDDGDKSHNALSNLAWKTPLQNMSDRHRHGTTARGERAGRAKLTAEDVVAIRGSDLSDIAAAKAYGCSPANIWNIRKRETWKHV